MIVEPVMIEQVRECEFKAKPCGLCGLPKSNRTHTPKRTAECPFKRQNGCASCGRNKGDRAHFGEPPSFNYFSASHLTGNLLAGSKQAWQAILLDLLRGSDLPTGLERVLVEGEVTFPTAAKRDQGNFRVIIEKAMGDALQQGGYLPDDDWSRYEFGNLQRRVVRGVSATRLMIFPLALEPDPQLELSV